MRIRTLLVTVTGAVLLPVLAGPALGAQTTMGTFDADLAPVPHDPAADGGSNASGTARLATQGNRLTVSLQGQGLSPGLPHAVHIHGDLQARNECPGSEAAEGGVDDGLIETVDGLPAYGPILVSFTTEGDTSAGAGLALDRMPVADGGGGVTYQRTIRIAPQVRKSLDDLHVVVHGHDIDGDGAYDAGPVTDLGAPLEAELPVACGQLDGGFRTR